MARITPVKLPSSSKTLWFDANGVDAVKGNAVIVQTARGSEYGTVSETPFDATPEQLSSLKSSLKPVVRLATEKDAQRLAELQQRARDIMPAYRELVEEEGLDMRPVSVEFLFDGDKAVFYFESEDRVDFRELVRKLASRFKVRVDMRQIGPRDEARMVGGIGHCGQELCCKRLGGEFCPVSIRMAKEQDLSLNPQKISGICGRLMCCLRYEYDAYKDFKGRAPKVGAKIETPDGVGKVISLDVPKEMVTIQVEADKKISVPLSDMSKSAQDAARPDTVDAEAWERASNKEEMTVFGEASFVTSQFTSADKLGEAKAIHRETSNSKKEKRERRGKDTSSGRSSRRDRNERERNKVATEQAIPVRKPRRRSTKLSGGDLSEMTVETTQIKSSAGKSAQDSGAKNAASREDAQSSRGRTRSRRNKGQASATVQDGQASSRAKGVDAASAHAGAKAFAPAKEQSRRAIAGDSKANADAGSSEHRRRRRSGKSAAGERPANGERAERNQQGAPQGHGRSEQREGQDNQAMRPGRRSSSLRQHADAAPTEGAREHRSNAARGSRNGGSAHANADAGASANAPANGEERRSNHRRPRRRKSSGGGSSAGVSGAGAGNAGSGNAGSNGAKSGHGVGGNDNNGNNGNNKGGAQQ